MKSYRLIKLYPESPKLGTIIESDDGHYFGDDRYFLKKYIENFPEYWEKVIEKDYKILSFNGKISKDISDDGAYLWDEINDEFFTWKDSLKYIIKKYGIKSVKRLSDNTVLSVGDRHSGCSYHNKIIEGFDIINNELHIVQSGGYTRLKDVNKLKPLLTTRDNVEIYQGDTFYFVTANNTACPCYTDKDAVEYHHLGYNFSTKEAAQDYIIKNKPCLSFKMLKNWGLFELSFPIDEQSLLDFIKTKIDE